MADLTIGEMWKKIDQFVDSKPDLKGRTMVQLLPKRQLTVSVRAHESTLSIPRSNWHQFHRLQLLPRSIFS